MKPKMKRSSLLDEEDIWNAVIAVLSEHEVTTTDQTIKDAVIAFQYYAELESGGHESLLNWFEDYIKDEGIDKYLAELTQALEKIGAHDYAELEKRFCVKMWNLYVELENDESKEEAFYEVIENADKGYYDLESKLEELLEAYFISIHTELIDVVE